MKKKAIKLFAVLLAMSLLVTVSSVSASAYDDNTSELEYNTFTMGTNYSMIWKNSAEIKVNADTGVIYNNEPRGTVKVNNGKIGYNETSATLSHYYGTPGNNGVIQTNNGFVDNNSITGDITDNYGRVKENSGVILYNRETGWMFKNSNYLGVNIGELEYNSYGGTIQANYGIISQSNTSTVKVNRGTIRKNGVDRLIWLDETGRIDSNEGTIILNEVCSEVKSNTGTITDNKGYVRNSSGGVVTNNLENGRVYNYGGTVVNNSGVHYLRVDLSLEHATVTYGEGFSSDNGIDCWLPAGANGKATITPDEGFAVNDIAVGGGILSAVKNADGSWELTVGGFTENTNAAALGISASLPPAHYTVTIVLGAYGDDIVVEAPHGTRFFDALDQQGVYDTLMHIDNKDVIFRDLATKPLDQFTGEEDFNDDTWALIDTTIESDMTVYACFFQKIKSVDMTLVRPLVGTTVVSDANYVQSPAPELLPAAGSHCYIDGTPEWNVYADDDYPVFFNGTFESDKTYAVTALLFPDFGYWLDENTVVNCKGAKLEESMGGMAIFVVMSFAPANPPLLGDADNNGEVEVIDATLIQRYLVGSTVPLSFDEDCADVDRDGEVDSPDVTWLLRYLAGAKSLDGINEYMT